MTSVAGATPADFLVDGGDDLVHVADHGVRRLGHHRGVGVGVDGEDDLGAGASGPVLDRAGDAAGDVDLGGDPAAGLADLLVVRAPAEAGDHAGHAERPVEQLGQLDDVVEAVRAAGAATGTHDDAGRAQAAGAVRSSRLGRHHAGGRPLRVRPCRRRFVPEFGDSAAISCQAVDRAADIAFTDCGLLARAPT